MVSPDDKLSEEEKRKRKKMIGNAVRDAFGGVRVTAGYHKPLQAPAYTPLVRKKSFDDADWDYRNFEKSSLVSWRAGWSLFLWSPTNRARMGLHALVKHRYFERLIILIIIGSCILLLLDYPNCPFADNVRYADAAFTCLFCMEAIMKILAMGFVLDRGSYMRDPWNWLDLAIAVVSASSLPEVAEGGSSGGQRATRVLRVFRAMRPIRLVQRFRGVRVVITSIVKALPYIGRVSLLVFIMWGFFAVMGMQLFMGRLSYCSEVTLDQADCVGQATVQGGAPIEREWRSNWENFDHIGNAMMTLFEMATLENWVFVMYSAMDSTGVTTAPQIESNVAASVFFLLFIICGVYAVMNWYISVVVMAFTQAQEELRVERDANESPDALHIDTDDLSNDQKQWAEMLQLAMDRPLRPRIRKPQAAWRKAADAVVRHKWFEPALVVLILVDAAVLMSNSADQSRRTDEALTWTSFCLSLLFLLEALLKIAAFGLKNFVRDRWRVFDLVIVVVTTVGSIVDVIFLYNVQEGGNTVTAIRAVRVLRVARVFRLFSRTKSLVLLFDTVSDCLPRLGEVCATFALVWFVFIIIGVQAFGTRFFAGNIDLHVNFQHAGFAATTLFSFITNERWNEIMWSITRPNPGDCPEGPAACDYPATNLFFVLWMWFGQIIFINLVVAVMIDAFSVNVRERYYLVRKNDIARYLTTWEMYDPKATGLIVAQTDLVRLLRAIGKPLGLPPNASRVEVARLLGSLRIPLLHGVHVHYRVLLHALIDRAYMLALVPLVPDVELDTRLHYTRKCPVLSAYMPPGNDTLHEAPTVAELFAALSLQARARGILDRKRVAALRVGGGQSRHGPGTSKPHTGIRTPPPGSLVRKAGAVSAAAEGEEERAVPEDYESDPGNNEHVVQTLIKGTVETAKEATSPSRTLAGMFSAGVPKAKPSNLFGLI